MQNYRVRLYRGKRCELQFVTSDLEQAQERSSLWRSKGEGHTATVETIGEPLNAHVPPIPVDEYLVE